MKRVFTICIVTVAIITFGACVEPYHHEAIKENPFNLVVDAFIDTRNNTATVVLNHSVGLNASEQPFAEVNANVAIEISSGEVIQLTEKGSGVYFLRDDLFTTDNQYRLKIETKSQKQYESAWVTPLVSPEIDDVSWQLEDNELKILVSSHDNPTSSRYYKWRFVETFEYVVPYQSVYRLIDGEVIPRTSSDLTYQCWKSDSSKNIIINNTTRFSENTVDNFHVHTLKKNTLQVSKEYSILVKQQSLSEEGYKYWSDIQTTNEKLGGLFDPTPGKVIGNIYNVTDPSESVIGYFDAGEISEKRLFIKATELPSEFTYFSYPVCELDTFLIEELPTLPDMDLIDKIMFAEGAEGPVTSGYITSTPICTDCRILGKGVTEKPSFWNE